MYNSFMVIDICWYHLSTNAKLIKENLLHLPVIYFSSLYTNDTYMYMVQVQI